MPVLGLIFLRHATTRFHALLPDVEKAVPARATSALREDRISWAFKARSPFICPRMRGTTTWLLCLRVCSFDMSLAGS